MIDFEQFRTKAEVIKYLKTTKDISCRTTTEAEKYLRAHLPKESYYQDKIIKHIRELLPSAFVWKAAAGPYSRQGIPDVCAIVNGRFYGFEVKRPFIGVLSKIQERTIKQIQEAGGKAYVVTYTAEVTRILQKRDRRHTMSREMELIQEIDEHIKRRAVFTVWSFQTATCRSYGRHLLRRKSGKAGSRRVTL